MNKQQYCEQLIEHKESGYTLLTFCKKHGFRYLPGLIIFILAILLLLDENRELNPYSTLIVGLYIGVVFRDIRWVLANKKVWPVRVFITDWSKVEEIAKGES